MGLGRRCLAVGVEPAAPSRLLQVRFEGKKASLFDCLEDLDYDACLERAQTIAGVSGSRPTGKMQAFVFLKPHAVRDPLSNGPQGATSGSGRRCEDSFQVLVLGFELSARRSVQVTDAAKKLVSSRFANVGITVSSEGTLDAATIEKDKLIDNHYYAIANKASLSKPAELNPPTGKQQEFEAKFGISWKKALADGVVFNAVDGCKRLGIDGATMDKRWVRAASRVCERPCRWVWSGKGPFGEGRGRGGAAPG